MTRPRSASTLTIRTAPTASIRAGRCVPWLSPLRFGAFPSYHPWAMLRSLVTTSDWRAAFPSYPAYHITNRVARCVT
eukprot:scaffold78391_cov18-Phaeocystis_antarctica.AAC.1